MWIVNGRQTPGNDKSPRCLWQGELKMAPREWGAIRHCATGNVDRSYFNQTNFGFIFSQSCDIKSEFSRQRGLLSLPGVCRPLTIHILIFSSEIPQPNEKNFSETAFPRFIFSQSCDIKSEFSYIICSYLRRLVIQNSLKWDFYWSRFQNRLYIDS
jgi:hypothetical protein